MLRQRLREADFVDGDAFDAERLRRQADALEERAAVLRAEARSLAQEAIDLRVEADRLTRAPLVTLGAPPAKPESTEFLERVVGVLEGTGAVAMRDLTEHLNATPARVRAALARLEELGTIRKTGIKRGTRYELVTEDDDDDGTEARYGSYESVVRDAAVNLDTFEFAELQRALPDLSEATLRRWVRALEDKGVFTSERVGKAKVYAYVPPESQGKHSRPRRATPEQEAQRTAGPARVRGDSVAGTGRAMRSGSSIVDELIREVRSLALGIETKKTAHKVVFLRDGVEIAHCSKTPGASSLKITRANLRKAGVPV